MERELQQKVRDYDIFGKVLLAVSAMLLMGLVVASEGKTDIQLIVVGVAVLISILGAVVSFRKSVRLQNKK